MHLRPTTESACCISPPSSLLTFHYGDLLGDLCLHVPLCVLTVLTRERDRLFRQRMFPDRVTSLSRSPSETCLSQHCLQLANLLRHFAPSNYPTDPSKLTPSNF